MKVLVESPLAQEIIEEGRAEYRKEWFQSSRQLLMTILQAKFPQLVEIAQQATVHVEHPDMFYQFCLEMALTDDVEVAQQSFPNVSNNSV